MLLDTSGTYTQELNKAQSIMNYVLAKLDSADVFAVARIDTASFSEKDIIAKVSFDEQPSRANQQKRVFLDRINQFVSTVKSSTYTDITGGLLQGVEFLREAGTGKKTILIFSDMKEEIPEGYVRNIPLDLKGIEVVALNVTKLRGDNIDPREYAGRLEAWKGKVEKAGGRWRVINDLERLEAIIQE
ncbi:MAG: VWA domain-containing protein [Thiohalomonadaceae bacterium]